MLTSFWLIRCLTRIIDFFSSNSLSNLSIFWRDFDANKFFLISKSVSGFNLCKLSLCFRFRFKNNDCVSKFLIIFRLFSSLAEKIRKLSATQTSFKLNIYSIHSTVLYWVIKEAKRTSSAFSGTKSIDNEDFSNSRLSTSCSFLISFFFV